MDWDSEIFSKDLNILLEKAGLRSIGGIFERLANAVEEAASNERGDFDPAEALGDLLDDLNDLIMPRTSLLTSLRNQSIKEFDLMTDTTGISVRKKCTNKVERVV